MAFVNESFSITRGDDRLVEIEVEDEAGADVDLSATGTKIRLTYGRYANRALVTKTEADLQILGKRAVYRMRPTETLALEADRIYWMQARVIFPDGTEDGFTDTVMKASFTVEQTQE